MENGQRFRGLVCPSFSRKSALRAEFLGTQRNGAPGARVRLKAGAWADMGECVKAGSKRIDVK